MSPSLNVLLRMLLLAFIPSIIHCLLTPSCPSQCICESDQVVCSCENSVHPVLQLDAFGSLVIDSLTIHSCPQVILANGTFTGTSVRNRLSIQGIANLTIHPFAFRHLQQAPKIFVLDNCGINSLHANAFSGLAQLDHIWIKNSHISSIHSLAFAHLSNVRYLYIHRVTMGTLHAKAFGEQVAGGGMYRVQHIFLRGAVKVDIAHSFLFADSSIEDIVFEDVEGKFSNLFLSDHEAINVVIRESRLSISSKGKPVKQRHKCVNSGMQLVVINSTIDNFEPNSYDFERIDVRYSSLGRVRAGYGAHSPSCTAPANRHLRRISIDHSLIESISEKAFAGVGWDRVEINRTRINEIQQGAFGNSKLSSLLINKCTVALIGERAFNQSIITLVHINDSQIGTMARNAFSGGRFDSIEVHSTSIQEVLRDSFSNLTAHRLIIDRSRLEIVAGDTFRDSTISHLSLDSSTMGVDGRSLFSSFSPLRLSITRSSFECNLTDCEFNNLLLTPSREELEWHFSSNTCSAPMASVCKGSSASAYPGGALCKRKWRILECTCEDSASTPALEPDQGVLLMGDCANLEVSLPRNYSLSSLYLFRIHRLNLVSLPTSLDTLHIYHSTARLRTAALSSASLHSFYSADSSLSLDAGSIHSSSISFLSLDRVRLVSLPRDALIASSIGNLSIRDSRARRLSPLLLSARDTLVSGTVLAEHEALTSNGGGLQLANNTLLCGCCSTNWLQPATAAAAQHCLPLADSVRMCYNYFGSDVCQEEAAPAAAESRHLLLLPILISLFLL
ncbi:hypothetical protein PMAYCL1PPCAC_13050, partial [Pristionchus mayeri]